MGTKERDDSAAEVITLMKAADRLNISYTTVLRLVHGGELPAFRVKHSWRTTTQACDDFVTRGMAEQKGLSQSVKVE